MIFKLDDANGILIDLSTYVIAGSVPIHRQEASTGLGGGRSFWFYFKPEVHLQLAEIDRIANGPAQSYEYGPEGDGAGKVKLTGKCHLQSLTHNGNHVAVTFVQTGEQERGAY